MSDQYRVPTEYKHRSSDSTDSKANEKFMREENDYMANKAITREETKGFVERKLNEHKAQRKRVGRKRGGGK